jgi:hypothetical protein
MNVRKSTRGFAIAASTLLLIACGGSGTDGGGSGTGGGGSESGSGTGTGSSSGGSGGSGSGSGTSSSSSPTSGNAGSGDAGSGAACVQPGQKSNDQGVGAYCDSTTPCPTNTFCTADFGAPVGAQFCSKTCTTDDQCGTGAFCYHEARGAGCVTNACK